MNNTTDCSCEKCNRAACGCSADGNKGCSCSDGLQASSKGARVRASGVQRTVIDGPFAETKELLVGTSIIQGKSKDEAIAFANRRIEVPMESIPVDASEKKDGWLKKEQEFRAPECGCEKPCKCNGCGYCGETK